MHVQSQWVSSDRSATAAWAVLWLGLGLSMHSPPITSRALATWLLMWPNVFGLQQKKQALYAEETGIRMGSMAENRTWATGTSLWPGQPEPWASCPVLRVRLAVESLWVACSNAKQKGVWVRIYL